MLDRERERGGEGRDWDGRRHEEIGEKKETRERKSRDGERIGRKRERGGG